MYPIQRQADVYGIFEPQNKPERTAAVPQSEVADLLRPPGIMAGLNVIASRRQADLGDAWNALKEAPGNIADAGQSAFNAAGGQQSTQGATDITKAGPALSDMGSGIAGAGGGLVDAIGDVGSALTQDNTTQGTAVPEPAPATTNINAYRYAVDTRGMDPDSHAYATEQPFSPHDPGPRHQRRDWDPNTGYQPNEHDEAASHAVMEDDESGYNWGPEPRPEDIAGPGMDPNFRDGRPLPFGTPTYNTGGGYEDYPGGGYDGLTHQ